MESKKSFSTLAILKFWTLFIGIGAVCGAIMMWIDPTGKMWGMETLLEMLQTKMPWPDIFFKSFIPSGFVLLIVNGFTQFCSYILLRKKHKLGPACVIASGVILMLWIVLEWCIFGFNFLSNIYFVFGILETLTAVLYKKRIPASSLKTCAIAFLIFSSAITARAQQDSRYPALKDSSFVNNPVYQNGNKYQRDMMLFMDMLTDTHPYYIRKDRRDSLMATQPEVLKACGACNSDEEFTQLLCGVLGKLHDKHTDVIDPASLAKAQQQKQQTQKQQNGSETRSDAVMAYGGDLFHYRLFPEHSICYLQFNQCQDARTARNESLPRWDTMLEEMFARIKEMDIQTLVVDAQYNGGGSSMLCDELLIHLRPFDRLELYSTSIRFSNLMGSFNPRIAVAKKAWEEAGHVDELYPMPEGRVSPDFVQPEIFKGNVIFIQSAKTYSSAGILMTMASDNQLGTIVGETSSFSPSHYGEILPYSLPNTGELGSVCTKFFARPDKSHLDDEVLEPMVRLDLSDKEAAWQFIVSRYGQKDVKHPIVVNEE